MHFDICNQKVLKFAQAEKKLNAVRVHMDLHFYHSLYLIMQVIAEEIWHHCLYLFMLLC